ncbi:hypothetical protein GH714_037238 [Hevea brasiliensis]|uniref:Integrase catalytic domain-containing protein n=1 Tax=Hevea brasiliensis TaxID=3981 RepID=A0A6A6LT59_HEVBR|nr:hypothetical protein GH714_037238 [Hevea brasiliensis]
MRMRLPSYFCGVVKYWGLPRDTVSDRDARFTGRFWTELFRLMGTDLRFSTSFHPQTDGQTKRINALLELYLRHFVSANQRDWPELVDVAQFSYNLQKSEATGASPFEIATGHQPLTPHMVVISYKGPNSAAFRFAKHWKEQVELARTSLARASRKIKKWANSKHRHLEFEEGDLVLVRMFHRTHGKRHKGLLTKYEEPFPIERCIGKVAYRVKLPAQLECHPVFHISLLKPYYADHEDPTRNKSKRAPVTVTSTLEHELKEVVVHRVVPPWGTHPGYTEYLVKWKVRGAEETSWEHELKL